MNVTKDIAKKFAKPDTYKVLEQGVFTPESGQALEPDNGFKCNK